MAITEFQIIHGICSVFWLKRCSPGDSVFDPPVGGHSTFHKVINHNSKKVTVNCQDILYIYILYHKCIYIYIITCLFGVFTCALASRLSMPLPEVTVDPDMIQVAGGVNSKVGSFSLQMSSPKSLPIRHQQKEALYMKTAISSAPQTPQRWNATDSSSVSRVFKFLSQSLDVILVVIGKPTGIQSDTPNIFRYMAWRNPTYTFQGCSRRSQLLVASSLDTGKKMV